MKQSHVSTPKPWCAIHQMHPETCFWLHNRCYVHKRIGCMAQYCKQPEDERTGQWQKIK